jgi:hypothetical protein
MSSDDPADVIRQLCKQMGVEVWEGEHAEAAMHVAMAAALHDCKWGFSRRVYLEAHAENERRDRLRRSAERERRHLPPLHTPGDAARVARALAGRRVNRTTWRCRCPIHGGNSLEVKDGHSRLLVTCWGGGCNPTDILRELRRRGII